MNFYVAIEFTFQVLPFISYAFSPTMLPVTVGNIFGTPVVE
jgi:hypothetical protein